MMPDGAEPCKGFRELLAEADRHIKTIAELRREVDLWQSRTEQGAKIIEGNVARLKQMEEAIRRIDGINDNPAHYNPDINTVCDPILRPASTHPGSDQAPSPSAPARPLPPAALARTAPASRRDQPGVADEREAEGEREHRNLKADR